MAFPTALTTLPDTTAGEVLGTAGGGIGISAYLDFVGVDLLAIETKLGVDGSAVTTSHDYKLGEVTGSDKTVGKTATQTLTNKRITSRVLSATSYTTNTGTSLNIDNLDQFIVTAQAEALLFNNPTGTAVDGQKLIIAVTGTAARALTYGNQFEASTIGLPTTTVTTARLNMGFIFRSDTSKWVCVASV